MTNPFDVDITPDADSVPADAPVAVLASAQTEIAAMRRIVGVLDALDPNTRQRVFAWLTARYA